MKLSLMIAVPKRSNTAWSTSFGSMAWAEQ